MREGALGTQNKMRTRGRARLTDEHHRVLVAADAARVAEHVARLRQTKREDKKRPQWRAEELTIEGVEIRYLTHSP
jgi:hypothetical protein